MCPYICKRCSALIIFDDHCAPKEYGCKHDKEPEQCEAGKERMLDI